MSQDAGTWRLSLDTTISNGLKGGHIEDHGLDSAGGLVDVTSHRHEVELDLARYELGLSRTFSERWDAILRLPYLVKEQTARISFPHGGDDADLEAARRNSLIHHRTETYEGFGDGELSAGWRGRDILGAGSAFRFSLGVTLPFGDTEDDPWLLGDAGLEHLHVLFGNGTFDPVMDFYYGLPITDHWAVAVYSKARLPLYENRNGYRGSPEVLLAPRLTCLLNKNLSVWAGMSANYSGYSHWEKTGRDPNSGQFDILATLGVGYKISESLTASASVLLPAYSKTFTDGEDALDLAPAFSLSVAVTF